MKLIKPSFEIWDQQEGLEGIYNRLKGQEEYVINLRIR